MLKAIVFNLLISEDQLDLALECMEPFRLVQIYNCPKHEATVAGENRGEDAEINQSVCVLKPAVRLEEINNLDQELWQIFCQEFCETHVDFGLVDLVVDVVNAESLASKL